MVDHSFTPPSNLESDATLLPPSDEVKAHPDSMESIHQHEPPSPYYPDSQPALPQDRVPIEILILIFRHLLQPIPPPLDQCGPPRSALRQPDLVSVMRACKLWESVAESMMYTRVATDDFARLLAHVTLPSMRRRLAFTKSLHLEYLPAGLEPSYASILRSGGDGWTLCGRRDGDDEYGEEDDEFDDSRMLAECRLEAEGLELALREAVSLGMKEVFPRLDTLAVGSIYGESETWDRLRWSKRAPELKIAIPLLSKSCMEVFNTFITSGSLKHLCVKSSYGPLTLPPISYESQQPTSFTKTVHFDYDPTDNLHLSLGTSTRWVFDAEVEDDWGHVLQGLSGCIQRLIDQRSSDIRTKGNLDAANLEIFCSSNYLAPGAFSYSKDAFGIGPASGVTRHQWKHSTTVDQYDDGAVGYTLSNMQKQRIVTHLDSAVQQRFRRSGNKLDSVRWRLSSLTPICEACGSGPADGNKL